MIGKRRKGNKSEKDTPEPESLRGAPFVLGYDAVAHGRFRPEWLPGKLARLAQRAVEMSKSDEGNDRIKAIYGTASHKEALDALAADSWIINPGPDGENRSLSLAVPPGENLLDDIPPQSMIVSDTLIYRSADSTELSETIKLEHEGEWVFMYEGWLVRCNNPVARRGDEPVVLKYSLGEARRLGFSKLYSATGDLPAFVHVRVYIYRLGLPDGISLQELIDRGDAVPSPLRFDLRKYPGYVLKAHDMATPKGLQKPKVLAAIEEFIAEARELNLAKDHAVDDPATK